MSWMTVADFEARYRVDGDPWGYTSRAYEREKYGATLAACGPGPFARALELGSSIGVFSALLAPRCEELRTLDASPTAVADARTRLGDHPGVAAELGEIPGDIPEGPFNLVVASEILYYLTPEALERTLARLPEVMTPGARLVAVHWRPAGPERPFDAETVHRLLRKAPGLTPRAQAHTDDYLLDVLERSS